jgi:hypothetical protein
MCGQDSQTKSARILQINEFLILINCMILMYLITQWKANLRRIPEGKMSKRPYVTISENMKVIIISFIVESGCYPRHERLLPYATRQRDVNLAILIESFLCLSKKLLWELKVSHEPHPPRPTFTIISYSTLAWADRMRSVKWPSADWAIVHTPSNFLPNG